MPIRSAQEALENWLPPEDPIPIFGPLMATLHQDNVDGFMGYLLRLEWYESKKGESLRKQVMKGLHMLKWVQCGYPELSEVVNILAVADHYWFRDIGKPGEVLGLFDSAFHSQLLNLLASSQRNRENWNTISFHVASWVDQVVQNQATLKHIGMAGTKNKHLKIEKTVLNPFLAQTEIIGGILSKPSPQVYNDQRKTALTQFNLLVEAHKQDIQHHGYEFS